MREYKSNSGRYDSYSILTDSYLALSSRDNENVQSILASVSSGYRFPK